METFAQNVKAPHDILLNINNHSDFNSGQPSCRFLKRRWRVRAALEAVSFLPLTIKCYIL